MNRPKSTQSISFERVTWEELVRLEPALESLRSKASAVRDTGGRSFCANRVWFGSADRVALKAQLDELVGWGVRWGDAVLRSKAAYDVAYDRIYNELPACRNCMCF